MNKFITRLATYIAATTLALTGMQAFGATATIAPLANNTMAADFPDNSSGVMRRIAAPLVGGMVTAPLVSMLLIPVLYVWWKGRELNRGGDAAPTRTRL